MSAEVAYMAIVYIVILSAFALYVASIYFRQQRLRRELQSLEELEKSRTQAPQVRSASRS